MDLSDRFPLRRRLLALPAILAATLGLVWGSARAATPAPIPPADLEGFVDGAVADGMAASHVAGVTVAVVQGGKVLLLKGYGQSRPGQAVDPERDLFRIGSISKTFTWVLLMQEVERGRIRLDAPVNAYLPPELRVPDQGFGRPVRILDLMSHSAGFEVVERNHLTVEDPARIIPEAEELRRHRPRRVREPGMLASYSNYGATLAGEIVARTAGRPFQDLVEQRITGPLGMSHATFREPYPARPDLPAPMAAALAARVATGFDWRGGAYRPGPFEYVTSNGPAGAVSATAPDMARYMLMLLNGGTLEGVRIFGPQTAAAFRTPILKTPDGVNGWAHGFMIRTLPGGELSYGHGGSLDRFLSNMSLVPDLDLGVFVSTNTSTGRGLAESLPKLIVQRFHAPGISPRRPGDPGLVAQGGAYAGRYVTTRRAYEGLEEFADLLESHDRVWVDAQGYLVTKLGEEVRSWVPDGGSGRFVDAEGPDKLVFTRDAQGRVTGFPFPRGTYTAERVGPLLDDRLFAASAALTLAGALGAWICAAVRCGPGPTGWRRWADRLGLAVASLWLFAFAAFWGSGLPEGHEPAGDFPGPWLLTASWAAVLAVGGTVVLAAAFVPGLRDRPAGEGAAAFAGRTARRGLTLAAYLLFALLLAAWGGLAPWA